MFVDKYKTEDGYEYQGCWYDNAEDVIGAQLGFCGCCEPEEALIYVRDALNLVDELNLFHDKKITYDEWVKRKRDTFNSLGEEYFMWYYLDNKGFIEHGSSLPGWLTEEGKELMSDLNEIFPKE